MFQNPESSNRILRVKNIDTNSFVPFSLNYTESSYLDEISEKMLPGNSNVPALGGCFRAWADVLMLKVPITGTIALFSVPPLHR